MGMLVAVRGAAVADLIRPGHGEHLHFPYFLEYLTFESTLLDAFSNLIRGKLFTRQPNQRV